jgi:succinate-semialdehyde dehydrogenase/glutarate-semialdehyde dehydrogenase
MGTVETQNAINAASQTFKNPTWRKSLAKDRAKILHNICALHREHADDLATIMTLECGKPFAEARGEVEYSAGYVLVISILCLNMLAALNDC